MPGGNQPNETPITGGTDRTSRKSHKKPKSVANQLQDMRISNRKPHSQRPRKHLQPLKKLSNGEHINLSCRFVLKSTSTLTPTTINVEKPIPPSQIWRVFSPPQECPVCLETAEVPRMMNCGHIMCLNCMIQHRHMSASPNACAICGESVSHYLSSTLAVTFIECDTSFLPKENEEVVLTLMKRVNTSSVVLPVNLELDDALGTDIFPNPDYILWSRLCQGSLEYATRELAQDLKTLVSAKHKSIEDFGSDEGHSEAIAEMKAYIHTLKSSGGDRKNEYHNRSKEISEKTWSYYYQVAFESPTFYTLSALDVSILRAAFGSYENLPTSLIAKVENIEYGIIDHTNDKRLNFLWHIPEQTPVAFLECDWTGIVPDQVLQGFQTKLVQRQKNKLSKTAKDILENEKAQEAIENQFKIEVAEALTPHETFSGGSQHSINTAALPSLPSKSPDSSQTVSKEKIWVDHQKEYDEIMKNTYVTERGRKKVNLRF